MGRNAAWLSERQLEVLGWIRDGCPEVGVETGYHRRITARALARRGLVKVKGHGASWRASITPAGVSRLDAPPKAISAQDRVDGLLRRVVAAGGRLEVDDGEIPMYADEFLRRSEWSRDRPKGQRLARRYIDERRRRSELFLVRHIPDLVEEEPVPVPDTVSKCHPTVRAFLSDRDRQLVSREHVPRAARILQAFAAEAQRRGMRVLGPGQEPPDDPYHRLPDTHWQLYLLPSSGGAYGVRVSELSAPGGRALDPPRRDERRSGPAWLRNRQREFIGTGMLELVVDGPGMSSGGTRHRDARTVPLEGKLPRVFRRIEIHRLESEHREEQRRREAAERKLRWEAAMAEARVRYDEEARWDAFAKVSREWRRVGEQRAFLAAARAAVDGLDGPQCDDLLAHLASAEGRLDALDPMLHPDLMLPTVPDPKPEDLKPFLRGWSPHGPESWH